MKCKFSTFAKKAKLVKDDTGDDGVSYTAGKNQLITRDGEVVDIVMHVPAHVEKNPLGGIDFKYDEGWAVYTNGDDTPDEYGSDPVANWELYKKVKV